MGFPILSAILLCPIAALLIVLLIPGRYENVIRLVSLAAAGASLILSIILCLAFDASRPAFQFVENVEWVKSYGINYSNAVDGLNISMILLTSIVIFCG